jgi:prepilin-type N-terminal cleavage/methylation domain-containing protein/prepilin-type processing-associated H-X9-DG protein
MKKNNAFTLIELLVVISIIALLLAILLPTLNKARDQAKMGVCLQNLHSLSLPWLMYADDYDDRMMNALTARIDKINNNPPQYDWRFKTDSQQYHKEPSWVGWWDGSNADEEAQKACLEIGLLYPYCNTTEIYLCPAHEPYEEWRTYAIADSMNGYDSVDGGEVIHKIADIRSPAGRMVFIDEGYATTESWTVWANQVQWWDGVPLRHGEGTTVSLADGHAEYWIWQDERTVLFRKGLMDSVMAAQENPDFKKIQRAVWGRYVGAP